MATSAEEIRCACGNGPASTEPAASGLYTDDAGVVRRICGKCWMRETMSKDGKK